MVSFTKRMVAFVAVGALALAGLVGCGPAEPKDALELVARSQANPNAKNYHSDLDYDISLSLFGTTMPMSMKIQMDTAGDASHGTATTSAMGQSTTSEVYVQKEGEEFVQYASTEIGSEVTWSKTEVNLGALASTDTLLDMADGSELAKTDSGYTLTIPGSKLMEAMESAGGDLTSSLSSLGLDSLEEQLKNADCVLTFDKDCLLTGMTYSVSFEYSYGDAIGASEGTDTSATDANAALSMSISMDIKLTVSGYGTVKEESVALPEDVKKNAVDTGAITDDLSSLLGGGDLAEVTEDAEKAEAA